jgi:hypothetical protein
MVKLSDGASAGRRTPFTLRGKNLTLSCAMPIVVVWCDPR